MKQTKKKTNNGITLVALVVTIIILLILAGITINALTDNGLFGKTKEAKEKYSRAETMEKIQLEVLASYDNNGDLDLGKLTDNITKNIDGATIEGSEFPITVTVDGEKFIVNESGKVSYNGKGSSGGSDPVVPEDPTIATNPATSITEAQSDYMLTKTVNSPIEDAYGNKITIPAGFKIKVGDDTNYTNNVPTADKGIVIIDSNENEFVWIPVPENGKIYTDIARTEASAKTVELNRYTFDVTTGEPRPQNDDKIVDFQELQNPSNGNTPAKSIINFKQSVANNKGYYIGRYEARTETERNSSNKNTLTPITEKGTDFVYNYVTQIQAAQLAQNMYNNTNTFTSDLMNSYAWDSAILFLQRCGTNTKYSIQNSVNTRSDGLASTGTNNTTKKDVQCNIYDIASNVWEWTTENASDPDFPNYPFVYRGGFFDNADYCSSDRGLGLLYADDNEGFRPLLYL